MTKLEMTIRKVSDLRDFYLKIKKKDAVPAKPGGRRTPMRSPRTDRCSPDKSAV